MDSGNKNQKFVKDVGKERRIMKKKQVIAIAAALAAVLLMSTAVYAIGNMGEIGRAHV